MRHGHQHLQPLLNLNPDASMQGLKRVLKRLHLVGVAGLHDRRPSILTVKSINPRGKTPYAVRPTARSEPGERHHQQERQAEDRQETKLPGRRRAFARLQLKKPPVGLADGRNEGRHAHLFASKIAVHVEGRTRAGDTQRRRNVDDRHLPPLGRARARHEPIH